MSDNRYPCAACGRMWSVNFFDYKDAKGNCYCNKECYALCPEQDTAEYAALKRLEESQAAEKVSAAEDYSYAVKKAASLTLSVSIAVIQPLVGYWLSKYLQFGPLEFIAERESHWGYYPFHVTMWAFQIIGWIYCINKIGLIITIKSKL